MARQTPTDRIRRWAEKIEMPRQSGLSKAKKKLKKMEMPRPKGLSKAADKLKEIEIPRASGLSKAKKKISKADMQSPKQLRREMMMRRRLERAEAKLSANKRKRSLRKRLMRFGVVSSAGAFLMYLFDPEHGQARREKMSKKLDETLNSNLDKNKPSGSS